MRRLALDLATKIGWAATDPRRPSGLAYGTEQLPSDVSDGRVFALFVDWLSGMIDRYKPEEIGVERAFIPSGEGGQPAQVLKAYGWYTLTALLAQRRGIRLRLIATNTAKKAMTGRGNAEKVDVMEACRARGLEPRGFDEADAIAVHFAMGGDDDGQEEAPEFSGLETPRRRGRRR